jgi:triphosphatase
MPESREMEWQFDALDLRPVERWLSAPEEWQAATGVTVAPDGSKVEVDLYLDTDDWRFRRAGYALRLRRVGRRRTAEATLEGLDSVASGERALRVRRELSESIEAADPALLLGSGGEVGDRARAVAGRKPLLSLFEIRTRRRVFTLTVDGLPPAELSLEETTIRAADGEPPTRLRRVEIDAVESVLPRLTQFVERLQATCALQPARLSGYEAGLLAGDLRPVSAERFGATQIDPGQPIGAVALAVLRRHFTALLAKEPGTRLGDDIEELHDMRVASRRLRAALSLFADVAPPAALEAGEDLAWLGRVLGAVRDLDVQLEQLEVWLAELPEPDRAALEELAALLRRQRDDARVELLEALDSRRYESLVSRFGRVLRARPARRDDASAEPALAVAPDLIETRFRRMRALGRRIGPGSPAEDYHRLRIRCKRLRYALEFLADLYPGKAEPLLRRLAALQDVLGLHQDADVAIERLRALARDHAADLDAATIFAMGEIAERHRRQMVDLRRRFPRVYARATGKRWTSFVEVLAQARPTVDSTPPEEERMEA